MRLIDANEVLCFIKDEIEQSKEEKNEARARDCENDAAYNSGEIQEARRIERHILNAPIIDAVPVVHGRWMHEQRYGDSGGWVWRCTACRREAISPIISALKYCHSCGAKMDAKEEDNEG